MALLGLRSYEVSNLACNTYIFQVVHHVGGCAVVSKLLMAQFTLHFLWVIFGQFKVVPHRRSVFSLGHCRKSCLKLLKLTALTLLILLVPCAIMSTAVSTHKRRSITSMVATTRSYYIVNK